MQRHVLLMLLFTLALVGTSLPLVAQDADLPMAEIENDEGGPVAITGEVVYTNPFLVSGVEEPMVILEDQAGFVDRDRGYLMPIESQVLGQITSDFLTSPFTYSISVPIEPQGTLRDVDQDGENDEGVMVYAVAYWNNVFGDAYLEERDLYGGGWSTAYASTRVDPDISDGYEYRGGTLVIYAPDDQQGFPSGFGDDEMLFTDDDPVVRVPEGWTIVNLDTDPFTFSREKDARIDLIEGEASEVDDFSDLSYTEAFDALVDKMRVEYAYTELKEIDWDALSEEFRPLVEAAEADDDQAAFEYAIQQFTWAIPDIHVYTDFTDSLFTRFQEETTGGIGMAIRELDDERTVVNFVLEGGPAAEAGIELGAEILELNGLPIGDALGINNNWGGPFSNPENKRLQDLRYAMRFPVDSEVEVTFQNPGDAEPTTATLTAIPERESFNFSSFNSGLTGFELPVEYEILPSGYGYARILSFSDNDRLSIDLWERMIQTMNQNGVPGLIVDMRQNSGGSGFLATQMAAYFFNEPYPVDNDEIFDENTQDFISDPDSLTQFFLPPEEQRYQGPVAVIAGPACVSACEHFVYAMGIEDRAAVVGHYPTAGGGGGIEVVYLPGDFGFYFPVVRAIDPEGNLIIEGTGVVPTIDVPVTEETLFAEEDALVAAAEEYLTTSSSAAVTESGEIELGEIVSGDLAFNTRQRYIFTAEEDVTVNVILSDETGSFDTVLRVYDEDGNIVAENDDASGDTFNSAVEGLDVSAGSTIVIEVATFEDSGEGTYDLTVVEAE